MSSTPSVPPAQLALRFLLELGALVSLGAWAKHVVGPGVTGWLAMTGLPFVGATLWGVFAVPGDPSRSGSAVVAVPGWCRLLLELSVFAGGAAALAAMHEWTWFAIDAVGAEADGNLLQHVSAAKLKLQGGSPVALNWAIDSVRKGGTISVMGAYGPMFSAVKFGDALNKGLTLRMNQCPVKRQWPRLFDHIRNGYLKPSDVVTHRIPLDHRRGLPHLLGEAG